MGDIKKCPYCGGEVEVVEYDDFSGHLECTRCLARFESYKDGNSYTTIQRFNKYIGK